MSGGELLAADWGAVPWYFFGLGFDDFGAISGTAAKHDTASEDGANATLVEILCHILLVVIDEHTRSRTKLARNESWRVLVEGINGWSNRNRRFRGSQEIER